MDPHDPRQSPAAKPALSLKAITQDLIIDTLEPSQRLPITIKSLCQILNDDLPGIPLAEIERCVAAHAAAPITQALLERLPGLKYRMKATNHSNQNISQDLASNPTIRENLAYQSMKTTYLIRTGKGDEKTLVVEAIHTTFDVPEHIRIQFQLNMSYTSADGVDTMTARFQHTIDYSRPCSESLQSSNVQQLLVSLAEDLQLPVTSTPDLEALERAHEAVMEERRSTLRLEAHAAKVAHGWDGIHSVGGHKLCHARCEECPLIHEELRKALDAFDRPCTKYPLPELETSDARQRDVTFGRLLRALLPYDFRMGGWTDENALLPCLGSGTGTGDYEHTIEDSVVSIAVAGVDVDRFIQ